MPLKEISMPALKSAAPSLVVSLNGDSTIYHPKLRNPQTMWYKELKVSQLHNKLFQLTES